MNDYTHDGDGSIKREMTDEEMRQEREEQRMEHYRMKRAERQAWNPDGCDPEPDFPTDVLERQE